MANIFINPSLLQKMNWTWKWTFSFELHEYIHALQIIISYNFLTQGNRSKTSLLGEKNFIFHLITNTKISGIDFAKFDGTIK